MVVWFLLALASLFPSVASAEQAHEHGVATLDVAVDGRTLTLQFESPLDNVVGFEHAPRTDKQRAALKNMEEKLQATSASPSMPTSPSGWSGCSRAPAPRWIAPCT